MNMLALVSRMVTATDFCRDQPADQFMRTRSFSRSVVSKMVACAATLACAGLATVYAAVPSAEELAALSLQELSNIKVTVASLFAHTELNTPASVSIITEREWQRNDARQMTDAFGNVASIYTIPIAYAVRGISIRGLPLNGNAGVLMELDGVPIISLVANNTLLLNLGTLQSMEIVRGPGSALHGTNAFHGVIALHSFQAHEDLASVDSFATSDGYYQSTARYSNQLGAAGRASVAVAVNGQPNQHIPYSFTDGASGTTLFGERENRYNAQSVAFNLSSDNSQSWSYAGGVYLHRYDAQKFSGFGTAISGERDTSDLEAKLYLARLGINKQFTSQRSFGFGGYYWNLAIDTARFAKSANVFTQALAVADEHRAGIRAIYKDQIGDHTQLAVGLNYARQAVGDANQMTLADTGALLSSVKQPAAGAMRKTSSAMFEGNSDFFAGRFSVTYGARYDAYSDVDSQFSPRLGLIYHPQANSALKLLYGHAFRAPVALEIYGGAASIQGDPNLKAETFDTTELVWMKQEAAWRLQFSAFHSVLRDAIVYVRNPTPPPPLRATNLGTTNADGIELEWQVQHDRWYANGNSTYVATDNETTGTLSTIPKWVVVVGVGYAWPALHTDLAFTHRMQSQVDDAVANGAFAPTQLPAYSRTDARLAKQLSARTKLWLSARNLFARNNRVPSSPAAQYGVQDESFSIGAGASYGW